MCIYSLANECTASQFLMKQLHRNLLIQHIHFQFSMYQFFLNEDILDMVPNHCRSHNTHNFALGEETKVPGRHCEALGENVPSNLEVEGKYVGMDSTSFCNRCDGRFPPNQPNKPINKSIRVGNLLILLNCIPQMLYTAFRSKLWQLERVGPVSCWYALDQYSAEELTCVISRMPLYTSVFMPLTYTSSSTPLKNRPRDFQGLQNIQCNLVWNSSPGFLHTLNHQIYPR